MKRTEQRSQATTSSIIKRLKQPTTKAHTSTSVTVNMNLQKATKAQTTNTSSSQQLTRARCLLHTQTTMQESPSYQSNSICGNMKSASTSASPNLVATASTTSPQMKTLPTAQNTILHPTTSTPSSVAKTPLTSGLSRTAWQAQH